MTASQQPDKAAMAPPIYGYAMLKDVPETLGVANKMKVWPHAMARQELSVKFLNGPAVYQEFIQEVAHEWEKVADVRFHFLTDNTQEAMIRIGFDYVPGMQSSWSYTGTDHTYLLDNQNEPTMHFARWRRVSDECKRSDVLRAFGQVLGLELEYRHPDFYPAWKTKEDGTIDEAYIRAYWEDELANFITWDELKTMVLDPINVNARFIGKTESYDQQSVMCWPFYDELMARNIRPITQDSDYNTELSALDKSFIIELYGKVDPRPNVDEFFPLIEFNYTGTSPSFKVTTTKNLGVKWDKDGNEYTPIDLPKNSTEFTTTISHTYNGREKRKIIIGEILGYKQEKPTSSTALKLFDFTKASGAENILIQPYNQALETVWIRGDSNFIAQNFNFAANEYIKNLYLIGTKGSTVDVDNCKRLELLSTTPSLYQHSSNDPLAEVGKSSTSISPRIILEWPFAPMQPYSLGDSEGNGINIQNCNKLKYISLDNTYVKNISFANRGDLEYVYLSSMSDKIAGGGTPNGTYLLKAIESLPSRSDKSSGRIHIRCVGVILSDSIFVLCNIDRATLNEINRMCSLKNWIISWGNGTNIID